MALPDGWKAEFGNPRFFFDKANEEDNWGLVEDYALEGKRLKEYVEGLPAVAAVISRTPLTIDGHDAIETIEGAAYTVIDVHIERDDRVIRVSFRALKEQFPECEAAYRQALRSIRFEKK